MCVHACVDGGDGVVGGAVAIAVSFPILYGTSGSSCWLMWSRDEHHISDTWFLVYLCIVVFCISPSVTHLFLLLLQVQVKCTITWDALQGISTLLYKYIKAKPIEQLDTCQIISFWWVYLESEFESHIIEFALYFDTHSVQVHPAISDSLFGLSCNAKRLLKGVSSKTFFPNILDFSRLCWCVTVAWARFSKLFTD